MSVPFIHATARERLMLRPHCSQSLAANPMAKQQRLLFVCLGNICRSPMAEGIFIKLSQSRGVADRFLVDSAGTGSWHVGSRPDPRAIKTAANHGIELPSRARQVLPADIFEFNLILAMDSVNLNHLINMGAKKARLMRSFEPGNSDDQDVPDPYYGSGDGFERVYDMLVASCNGLLDHLV
jgi:protein-tyrosine phosphatase